jgi:hypothetical protein
MPEVNKHKQNRLRQAGAQLAPLGFHLQGPAKPQEMGVGPLRMWPGGLCVSRWVVVTTYNMLFCFACYMYFVDFWATCRAPPSRRRWGWGHCACGLEGCVSAGGWVGQHITVITCI